MEKGRGIWDSKIPYIILAVIAAGSLILSAYTLFSSGALLYLIPSQEHTQMMLSLTVFFIAVLFCLVKFKNRRALICMPVLFFLYVHQVLVTGIISGIYIFAIIMIGSAIRKLPTPIQAEADGDRVQDGALDFLLGALTVISLTCIVSLFGRGSVTELRILVGAVSLVSTAVNIYFYRKPEEKDADKDKDLSLYICIAAAVIITMLMLQAGRINIAADYDSLHYGLRSEFILDNGHGIYENLGNINEVYTYPKGFEMLLLPLSNTVSYGYILCFDLWLTAGVLLLIYKLTSLCADRKKGITAALIASCIPGIMNMGITAKADIITLLFQLFILLFAAKGEICYALAAGIFSFMLKPTAPVFSTGIMLCVLLIAWIDHRRKKHFHIQQDAKRYSVLLFSAAGCILVWLRTYLLTGYPITSIYTSIWSKLGFKAKYPFAFAGMPSAGSGDDVKTAFAGFIKRLYGLFLAPVGDDMAHVIIAWGTGLLITLLAVIFAGTVSKLRTKTPVKKETRIIYTAFIPTVLFSLLALKSLWQVDGNYFMLLYALIIILSVMLLPDKAHYRCLFAPWLMFNILVMSVTNWAGAQGLSPVSFSLNNVYDNQKEIKENMINTGNEKIWDFLKEDSGTRVIAFGEQPEVLLFPCNVQSYVDITGSGGNVWLVKTLDNFKSYLKYAKIEYIYVQNGYLEAGSRAEEVIRFMQEDKSITEIIAEEGNTLFALHLD